MKSHIVQTKIQTQFNIISYHSIDNQNITVHYGWSISCMLMHRGIINKIWRFHVKNRLILNISKYTKIYIYCKFTKRITKKLGKNRQILKTTKLEKTKSPLTRVARSLWLSSSVVSSMHTLWLCSWHVLKVILQLQD